MHLMQYTKTAFIVYVLVSDVNQALHYVGITQNLEDRLKEHNAGKVGYTKYYVPWSVETFITFSNRRIATKFEKYLKSGSGHAFLKKHLIS